MDSDAPATGKCNWCGRDAPLRQVIEWPHKGETERFGYYLCRWHQAAETRRKRRLAGGENEE